MPRKKITEEYIQECKEKGLDLPIEDYIGANIKIKHKCPKGHIYSQTPHSHLQGKGCPKCSGNYSYTPGEYYSLCKENDLDLPLEDYVNATTKIKHKCNKCGNIYKQTPNKHLGGRGCPKCGRKKMVNSRMGKSKKKTTEEYLKECKEKGLDLPIEDYKGNKIKIKHICKHGHIYKQRPSDHLNGKSCPNCNESHGEHFIRNYLDDNNIKYEPPKEI